MTIKGIFFDAAGVLYYRIEPTNVYVSRLLDKRGFPIEILAQDQIHQKALRSQAKNGQISPDEYWDQFLLMRGVSDPEERKSLIDQISNYSDQVLPIPGGREALAGLKQRGFILGIVTDTIYPIERKIHWLEKVGVSEFIDVLACSTALGIQKPDPAIYLNALKQANLTPDESAFVGHATRELNGARQAGLATVAVLYEPDARADYYATSLIDLLNVPILIKSDTQKAERMENTNEIEAIFIDVGNTMRIVVKDDKFQTHAKQQLVNLVGAKDTLDVFFERLAERYRIYRKWAKTVLTEASEKELWTRWMLPDYPEEMIASISGKLTRLWRDRDGRRVARPDVKEVVLELNKRGYCLGIIANTITETEIPDWLEEDGLADYFKTVVLSSKTGLRKPGPEIYLEAAQRVGVPPGRSIYVGDNPSRDIEGARLAGFGMVIILMEPATLEKEPPTGENKPDMFIKEFNELLEIFPARSSSSNKS
ncbi:MAG: HAD family hydrolase [Anaerolineales bacterium]|nr:HAD family hydrolase [Anaerolineales bacterium]